MAFFVGTYEYVLDDKGRVNVPARFRDQLPKSDRALAILKGLDGCLFVYPVGEVTALTDNFRRRRFLSDKKARRFQRRMFHGASTETPDAQGRVLLNELQREHAKLSKKVVFYGNDQRFEIWDPDRLQQHLAGLAEDEEYDEFDEWASEFFSAEPPSTGSENA